MIEGHGNDIHQLKGLKSDFSSNVAAREAPAALLKHLSENLHLLSAYPEADARTLRKDLSASLGLPSDQILVTNGSTEAFYLIANAFRGSSTLIFTPSFAEYEDACSLHGHELHFADINDFGKPFDSFSDTVWLGNPNNPNGRITPISQIQEKLEHYPGTLFIVDEAYGELCLGFKSALPLLNEFENLVVIRSMTKLYTIPGLRLGYLVAGKNSVSRLQKFMQPWNVNALAQAAGCFLLQHDTHLKPDVSKLLKQSHKLQKQLSSLQDLDVKPSTCNFFLIKLLKGNAESLKTYLLEHHDMLVRNASNFRGLSKQHVRISVQTEVENERLFLALKNYLNEW